MTEQNKPYELITYYALTTDPVHIGTGGYRLGRVDNSIVRDPATNLPKIPGTGISGVCRAYSALHYEKYPNCAGKGGEKGEDHCGKPDCPICTTFGFSKGTAGRSFQGLAQFFDARILFFPVNSMIGPVWITCASVLKEIGNIDIKNCEKEEFVPLGEDRQNPLNFGWLILENKPKINLTLPSELNNKLPTKIKDKLFQVEDGIFSRLVNDNLEVRTSVAIDPKTGSAESGALFTYEAIPVATVLTFDVIINNPKNFRIYDEKGEPKPIQHFNQDATIESTKEIVESGLKFIKSLGIGGMGTRGFGRMKILNLEEPSPKQGGKDEE